MRNIILLFILFAGLVGAFFAYQQYNKKHDDLSKVKPHFQLMASELFDTYANDELKADSLYLDKILDVKGIISKIDKSDTITQIFLKTNDPMFGINADMINGEKTDGLKPGDEITIRGLCSGFLMDVALTRCVLVD